MHPQDIKDLIREAMQDLQLQIQVSFSGDSHYGTDISVTVTLCYQGKIVATSTDTVCCPK